MFYPAITPAFGFSGGTWRCALWAEEAGPEPSAERRDAAVASEHFLRPAVARHTASQDAGTERPLYGVGEEWRQGEATWLARGHSEPERHFPPSPGPGLSLCEGTARSRSAQPLQSLQPCLPPV